MTIEGNVVMTSSKFQPGDTVRNTNAASLHFGKSGVFQLVHEQWTFAAGLACDVSVEGEDVIMSVSDLRLVEENLETQG